MLEGTISYNKENIYISLLDALDEKKYVFEFL